MSAGTKLEIGSPHVEASATMDSATEIAIKTGIKFRNGVRTDRYTMAKMTNKIINERSEVRFWDCADDAALSALTPIVPVR